MLRRQERQVGGGSGSSGAPSARLHGAGASYIHVPPQYLDMEPMHGTKRKRRKQGEARHSSPTACAGAGLDRAAYIPQALLELPKTHNVLSPKSSPSEPLNSSSDILSDGNRQGLSDYTTI